MSTETKKTPKGMRGRTDPVFICKAEIAAHLGVLCPASTIDRWIADGSFPPPHSRPGPKHAIWLRAHWQAYVATGRWPREAWPERK